MRHQKRVTWRWYAAVLWLACAVGCNVADAPWRVSVPMVAVGLLLLAWEIRVAGRKRS